MKKVLFVKREKGCETPESKAEALRKYGHLVSIKNDPISGGTIKYYSLAPLDVYDTAVEVTIIKGRVVSVRNISSNILSTLPPVNSPEFGGF